MSSFSENDKRKLLTIRPICAAIILFASSVALVSKDLQELLKQSHKPLDTKHIPSVPTDTTTTKILQ